MQRVVTTIIYAFIFLFFNSTYAQKNSYSTSNAHAHNDYVHPLPFYTAYAAGFGSIEADVFLVDSQLCVAHTQKEIVREKTLQQLYLEPLKEKIRINKGHVYKDHHKPLLLLIDIKTEAIPTLQAVVNVLKQYPAITSCKDLKIVITGNQPEISQLTSYPSWIFFDGHLDENYPGDVLEKVALFSDNFKNYSDWKGVDDIATADNEKIIAAIQKAHALMKPIRFWGGPDNPKVWKQMMEWKVDYINTDKIPEITDFLKNSSEKHHRKN